MAPSVVILSGEVYMSHVLPFSEYEVVATPLSVSVAVRVTRALLVYQPFVPRVPEVEAVVVEGVKENSYLSKII